MKIAIESRNLEESLDLSSPDRDRILSEEKYRAEVKRQLDALVKPKSRLWSFLNSALGLWLLSAIFVTGAGNAYQELQRKNEDRNAAVRLKLKRDAENNEAIERLDIEISYRISNALLKLRVLQDKLEKANQEGTPLDVPGVIDNPTIDILRRLYRVRPSGLYPEHAGFALPTLLVELRRRVSVEERKLIEYSLAKLAEHGTAPQFEPGRATPSQAASKVLNDIVLERWETNLFHFVHCSPAHPFC